MVEVLVDVGATNHRIAAARVAEVARKVEQPDPPARTGRYGRSCVEGEGTAARDTARAGRARVPAHDGQDTARSRVANARHVANLVQVLDSGRRLPPRREKATGG